MKIGIVFDDSLDRSDGVQQYIKTIGRWLQDHSHTVHYLVGESDPTLNLDLTVHSLSKNFGISGNQNILTLPLPADKEKIRHLLEKEQYDILHVQMPYNPLLSGRVINAADESTRIVGTFHIVGASWLENYGSRILSIAQRKSLKRFDEIISVSDAASEFAHRYFGIDTDVIPNAVDIEKFKYGKKLKKFNDGVQNIVYLNRLVKRKGCEYLIDAVHWLDNRGLFDNRRLIVCGPGPLAESLELKAKHYGLSEKVLFEGFIAEEVKADYLATADLAVFPSTGGESFGIVLIEAMASGALTLGGNNPGYTTVLGDKPELLIDPTDVSQFAERIDNLLGDKDKAKKLVEWQSEEVKKYDVNVVGKQLEQLYRGQGETKNV